MIDVLAMTISSEPEGAKVTLDALKGVREAYGVRTVLGVSNISFGLPYRPAINSNFIPWPCRTAERGDHQSLLRGYDAFLLFLLGAYEL